ncbi:Protein DPCD [Gryllus bimaculatus]|nr:Protein DPCD [Gryllus bimaculatus]
MAQTWLEKIKKSEKIGLIQDGKRKVHYRFREGEEMVEEYSMDTDVLVRRAWRKRGTLGADGIWEVEIGDPEPNSSNFESLGIKESNSAYQKPSEVIQLEKKILEEVKTVKVAHDGDASKCNPS